MKIVSRSNTNLVYYEKEFREGDLTEPFIDPDPENFPENYNIFNIIIIL